MACLKRGWSRVIAAWLMVLSILLSPSAYSQNIFTRVGKNLFKTVASVPVGAVRTVVGLTGYDIFTKEQGIPILEGIDNAAKLPFNTLEYLSGTITARETRELNEDGVINQKIDNMGPVGKVVRVGLAYWGGAALDDDDDDPAPDPGPAPPGGT